MTRPDDLMNDIPRGAPRRGGIETRLEDHLTPRAQFRDPASILDTPSLARSSHKLHLGVVGGTVRPVALSDGRVERHVMGGHGVGIGDDRHAVLVAGSRSGKGRCVIVPTLLDYEGSVLATDPKAELFNITAIRRARDLKQRVFGLDPFGIAGPHVARYRAGFNPMTILKPGSETLIEDSGLIADAMVIPGKGDSHWDDSARNWIETLILHVATHERYAAERNLATVHRLLMRGAVADGRSDAARSPIRCSPTGALTARCRKGRRTSSRSRRRSAARSFRPRGGTRSSCPTAPSARWSPRMTSISKTSSASG